jgi:hypothetical protein
MSRWGCFLDSSSGGQVDILISRGTLRYGFNYNRIFLSSVGNLIQNPELIGIAYAYEQASNGRIKPSFKNYIFIKIGKITIINNRMNSRYLLSSK